MKDAERVTDKPLFMIVTMQQETQKQVHLHFIDLVHVTALNHVYKGNVVPF